MEIVNRGNPKFFLVRPSTRGNTILLSAQATLMLDDLTRNYQTAYIKANDAQESLLPYFWVFGDPANLDSGESIFVIVSAAARTSSSSAFNLGVMRAVGPEILQAANTCPVRSNMGAAIHVTPFEFSSISNATPCSRTDAKCSRK
jgi:hypothetical protein